MLRDAHARGNEPAGAALQCAPMDGIEVVDIAHAIDLAVAPVFLLEVRIAIAALRIGSP